MIIDGGRIGHELDGRRMRYFQRQNNETGKGPFIPFESHLLGHVISNPDGHHVRPCVRMPRMRWI